MMTGLCNGSNGFVKVQCEEVSGEDLTKLVLSRVLQFYVNCCEETSYDTSGNNDAFLGRCEWFFSSDY